MQAFGEDILAEDGSINRKVLGGKVMGDAAALDTLQGIVWPRIEGAFHSAVAAAASALPEGSAGEGDSKPTLFVEAAVLLKAGWADSFSSVWGVVVSPDTALQRAVGRGMQRDRAQAVMKKQDSVDTVRAAVQTTISNDGGLAELEEAVAEALRGAGAVPLPQAAADAVLATSRGAADAGSSQDLITHVDEADNVVGSVRRWRMRQGRLWHRATYIYVRRSSGKLVVQKRSMQKDFCPGQWDVPTGGVVDAGEEWMPAAARELEEELGIPADKAFLSWCFKFKYESELARCWCGVLDCVWDGPIRRQESEVDAVVELRPDQIHSARSKGMTFTADGMYGLKMYEEWVSRGRPATMRIMPGNLEYVQWANRQNGDVGGSALQETPSQAGAGTPRSTRAAVPWLQVGIISGVVVAGLAFLAWRQQAAKPAKQGPGKS